jgi:hypothetical protein
MTELNEFEVALVVGGNINIQRVEPVLELHKNDIQSVEPVLESPRG